jgi:sugar phosphate isomerase/epimerase
MAHAKKAIKLSAEFGGKYYSFHAGYLLDPQASELGKKIKKKKLIDRTEGLNQFIKHVNELAIYAENFDITLLVENNVVSNSNFESFNCNPLLMTETNETKQILNETRDNVRLLVDVAHLKVSATTLNFDPIEYLNEFRGETSAYHISDNNGLEDSNEPFTKDSWFVPHISKDLEYYSLEIYVSDIAVLQQQYKLLSEILE